MGYFNLRGWQELDNCVDKFAGGTGNQARLLVGMQKLPKDELTQVLSLRHHEVDLDQSTAIRLKKQAAQEFRDQLVLGAPTNQDEAGLRRLRTQLKSGKLAVKLHLRHTLHGKLYLIHREDKVAPLVGFLGSSNLTFAGLLKQGELNIDVLDHDASHKLARWFEDRWQDRWSLDISQELIEIIDQSWAREEIVSPYHVYLKIVYHLSQEARAGLAEHSIPRDLQNTLFDFQKTAVQIAAHHVNKRGGVLIGDVVGLGKTLIATALARVLQDEYGDCKLDCVKGQNAINPISETRSGA